MLFRSTCIYLASPVLSLRQDAQQAFAARLLAEHAPGGVILDTNAPPAVEMTVLRSTTADAWLLALVNYQLELPNVPGRELTVTVALPDAWRPTTARLVSTGADLPWCVRNGALSVTIPCLETLEMVEFR